MNSLAVGKVEPNISTGLVLPVVREIKDGDHTNHIINMELVPSHYVVEVGDFTEEMENWIAEGYLIVVEEYVSKEKDTTEEDTTEDTTEEKINEEE